MYRRLEIEAVANGFIAHVGCQRLVYTGENREEAAEALCDDLQAYLIDPDKAEQEGIKDKCFNIRHTLNGPMPGGECCGTANAPPPGEPYPVPMQACAMQGEGVTDAPRMGSVLREV